jgi:hypothetical protein
LTLRRREEHGNTFAPEIELSVRLRWHSAKRGRNYREIRAEKNIDSTVQSGYPGVKSHWRGLGQITPHPANIGQMIGSQNISLTFEALIKIQAIWNDFFHSNI